MELEDAKEKTHQLFFEGKYRQVKEKSVNNLIDFLETINNVIDISYMEGYNQAVRDHNQPKQKSWNKGRKACKKCGRVHLSECNKN